MVGGKMVRITRQNCETPENLSADVPQEIQDAIELFRNPEYIGSLIKEKVEMAREQCGLSKVAKHVFVQVEPITRSQFMGDKSEGMG